MVGVDGRCAMQSTVAGLSHHRPKIDSKINFIGVEFRQQNTLVDGRDTPSQHQRTSANDTSPPIAHQFYNIFAHHIQFLYIRWGVRAIGISDILRETEI